MKITIAIDGPSGTGKSTVAKEIAKIMQIIYVDTGAMYRAMGYKLTKKGVNLDDEAQVSSNIDDISLEIKYVNGKQLIYVDDENVTDIIRTQEIGTFASKIAVYKKVRQRLVDIQKNMAKDDSVVMDGRDIGTVVLPKAENKFYLDASPEVRTDRRINELTQKGIVSDYNKILMEIIERDERDKSREESPLCQADDAIYIDTSKMTKQEVVDTIINKVKGN